MGQGNHSIMDTVDLDEKNGTLLIIDQTKLPAKLEVVALKTQQEIYEAIRNLQVRGAPAIGVAAAFGLYLAAKEIIENEFSAFFDRFKKASDFLRSSRPTAVNLSWALNRIEQTALSASDRPVSEIKGLIKEEALKMKYEDTAVCRAIGEHALPLINPHDGILTHCNAGWLATTKYGTALSPIYLAHERGYPIKVFADETRPLLQGARLTAFELESAGIDVTLICDNMASVVMKNGWVQSVFVGCDRVAANGDTANKIGTSSVAILARHYSIPFYVCAPTSTIDLDCKTGNDITIEERSADEVTQLWYKECMAPKNIKVFNPAFDVTDSSLITAFITERGVIRPPFSENISSLFQ
ncbi:MAG: S-methyl-5-thioribose-1-phosphate isomerase [Clostridiales bacterium]|nr:S-methyl-5-thioribose-1-phosphate isomerase [Clostridiales bacterium]